LISSGAVWNWAFTAAQSTGGRGAPAGVGGGVAGAALGLGYEVGGAGLG
jgi:hypothetical protein